MHRVLQVRKLLAQEAAPRVARALYLTQFRAILAEMDANEDNIISAQEPHWALRGVMYSYNCVGCCTE
eukprot:1524214-Amphidinium_carterae.3